MQAANAPPSITHSKVLPASVEVNSKYALALPDGSGGAEVMMVSGGVSSIIVQVYSAGVRSVLPSGSVALTLKV